MILLVIAVGTACMLSNRLHLLVYMYFTGTDSSLLQVIQRELLFRLCQGRWKES